MARGIIADTHTRRRSVCMLALLATLAVAAVASTAVSAAAAPQTEISSYHAASAGPSSSVSTLTNDVGQSAGGAEGQLLVGIGLLAAGLLGLIYGLAATRSTAGRRAATTSDDSRSGG